MYRGEVKEVFIPGVIDEQRCYSGIMEARYLGFKIEITEAISYDGVISKDDAFVGQNIIVIEPDTWDSAKIYRGDSVLISNIYFEDAYDCMMGVDDKSTYMIINQSSEIYLKKDTP